ncbi:MULTISPECIES: hypothetical protein [Brevibacillus]|uniref:hypothetical protein n=1 Tax=Brevibacillus TaxID=55080 RepID=UPI000D114113|nr:MULTISPECIES: hypothetical protein [Brevibacillus]MED1945678.1 hypothetical protein [Brevibacillus formosus]MED2000689.1 hypothetical protein [Brevibacillus formosus]MED2084465.1 hypothetical protein [Brevibacillus formosus]PSK15659.1 hypothetical protein C7R94_19675 [Brevibacillus sp. NRRL NRS-603]
MLEIFNDFFIWAFERHQNILSWYIRPLFLLPYCYFAYRKSLKGIILTLIALSTSMFWFPKPDFVDPSVQEFLKMERDYLVGEWDISKILITLLVPLSLFALAYAFWKKSWKYGVLVINLIALLKIVWSIYFGMESGLSVIAPAVLGLFICNGIIGLCYYFLKNKKSP